MDPFTYRSQDLDTIRDFDFIKDKPKTKSEKLRIEETFCTLVAVGGKYLEKKTFKKVLKKIDEIRRIIRIEIHQIWKYNDKLYIYILSMIKN
ncbi:hypothetical protein MK079_05580 [Candidatus Gracilibacteria bacterium]|nr:hypothetical protein [Candidatus Gracilibacteria bacterium]